MVYVLVLFREKKKKRKRIYSDVNCLFCYRKGINKIVNILKFVEFWLIFGCSINFVW